MGQASSAHSLAVISPAVSSPVLWLTAVLSRTLCCGCLLCCAVLWLHRYKTPAEVSAEGHAEELEQQVASMESMWGLTLTPGYDPQLTCMAHLWEVSHRLGWGKA
jgi:hypothetical protein